MTNNTRAITVLCEIMANSPAPVRRVEAAEQLLDYEAPPEIVEQAKAALASIFEDSETPDDIRLDALKLIRKAEARKVVPPRATVRDDPRHIELCRTLEILKRRSALVDAGVFPFPQGYDDDLTGPDFVPMPDA